MRESEDNDEEEDQVGEKGAGMRVLGWHRDHEPAGNLQMEGGGSNPYGHVGILTPASPGNLYGFLGFHTGYEDQL